MARGILSSATRRPLFSRMGFTARSIVSVYIVVEGWAVE
jgi:hypothetical protein